MSLGMATTLTTLLPSNSFLLAYSLPLFFSSLVLTFAGAFLTLDRTRSFAPRYDAIPGSFATPTKRKFQFVLEGGIGGLLIGYSFGLHLSTFLALLIPNKNSNLSSLSEKSFLATWFLSSLLTTFIGGRYKYAALALAGLTGGVAFSLSLCVIIHPSLLARIIFTCIITPILTILTLLPLGRFQHPFLRLAASSIGAFGLVVSIALLAKIPSWADVWSRYWLKASEEWGGAKEKGLSAGFCLFLLAGVGSDWLLSRFVGECPDEKWDTYLANYTSNLPNRAGTFKPFESFWDRWFRSTSEKDKENILFPDDTDKPKRPGFPGSRSSASLKPCSSTRPSGALSATSTIVGDDHGTDFDKLKPKDGERSSDVLDDVPSLGYSLPRSPRAPPAFLSKSRSQKAKAKAKSSKKSGKRETVKFGGDYTSSDEDEDDDNVPLKRPTFPQSPSLASVTTLVAPPSPGLGKVLGKKTSMGFQTRPRDDTILKEEIGEIDYEKEVEKLRGYKTRSEAGSSPRSSSREGREAPEYSDYESDKEKHRKGNKDQKDGPWTPGFLKAPRQQSASGISGASGASGSGSGSQASGSTLVSSSPRLGIVPATPSLIRALDRVALAQKDAYPYPTSPTAQEAQEQTKGQGSPVPLSLPRVEEEGKEHTKENKSPRRNDRWENFWRDVRDKAEAEGS